MGFLILLILIFLGFLGLLGWSRWRERRYLGKSTGDTMNQVFRQEIDREAQDTDRRRQKFEQTLKRHGF